MDSDTNLNWMLSTGASVKSDTHSMLSICWTWAPPSIKGSTVFAWTFSCGDNCQGLYRNINDKCTSRRNSIKFFLTVWMVCRGSGPAEGKCKGLHGLDAVVALVDLITCVNSSASCAKDMSLEHVMTGHWCGEAEELGGSLVAVEHIDATCGTVWVPYLWTHHVWIASTIFTLDLLIPSSIIPYP